MAIYLQRLSSVSWFSPPICNLTDLVNVFILTIFDQFYIVYHCDTLCIHHGSLRHSRIHILLCAIQHFQNNSWRRLFLLSWPRTRRLFHGNRIMWSHQFLFNWGISRQSSRRLERVVLVHPLLPICIPCKVFIVFLINTLYLLNPCLFSVLIFIDEFSYTHIFLVSIMYTIICVCLLTKHSLFFILETFYFNLFPRTPSA